MNDQAERPLAAPLRVVTVGAGLFSGFHVEAWVRNDQVSFAGLADLDLGKARTLLRDFGGEERQTLLSRDAGDLFAQVQPQIIDIAVPPDARLALIEKAAQTSARAIVCQKLFCATYELARRAVESTAAAGKLLVVDENFRFQPWYRAIKRELEAGWVGTLYQITFRLRQINPCIAGEDSGLFLYRFAAPACAVEVAPLLARSR